MSWKKGRVKIAKVNKNNKKKENLAIKIIMISIKKREKSNKYKNNKKKWKMEIKQI